MTNKTLEGLVDTLAAVEHDRWARWQSYVHSRCIRQSDGSLVIPAELVQRWERQIVTSFDQLTESEKDSDRDQVRRYLPLIVSRTENDTNSQRPADHGRDGGIRVFPSFALPPNSEVVASRSVFVSMPVRQETESVYSAIQEACRRVERECVRLDHLYVPSVIVDQLFAEINSADIVVADISGRNPNVYYEIGMADVLGKDVIIIASSMDELAFNIAHRKIVEYHNNNMQELTDKIIREFAKRH